MSATHQLPKTARRKVIKRREWEGPSTPEPVVYLDELATSSADSREFYVYNEDGRRLGRIHSYQTSITMKIKGTRFVKSGRRRTFWSTGGDYWKHLPSQAEAIRELLKEKS